MKRTISLILCLLLALLTVSSALAADGSAGVGWDIADNTLRIYAAGAESISVSAGGQTVAGLLADAETAGVPVTWFCVADLATTISTGGSYSQRGQMFAALDAVSGLVRTQDTMVLACAGKEFTVQTLSDDLSERTAAIHAIETDWENLAAYDTGLCAHIADAAQLLADTEAYPGIRCLVIVSGGIRTGVSDEEWAAADAAVASSGAAAAVIGTPGAGADEYTLNRIHDLQKAAASADLLITAVPDVDDTAAAVQQILPRLLSSAVLSLDANALPRDGGAVTLTVTVDGKQTVLTIPEEALPVSLGAEDFTDTESDPDVVRSEAGTTATDAEASSEETSAVTIPASAVTIPASAPTEPAVTQSRGLSRSAVILMAAGAVVVVVLIIMMVISRKRAQDAYDQMASIDTGAVFGGDSQNFSDEELQTRLHGTGDDIFGTPTGTSDGSGTASGRSHACRVTLFDADNDMPMAEFELDINCSRTLGRTNRANIILNAADTGLSGLHFEIHWDGRSLYLRDRGSTNGTTVGGVTVGPMEWRRLENGDEIGAGAGSYRIRAGQP